MLNKISRKKLLSYICAIAAIALLIGVFAYYNSTNSLDNRMSTAQYGNELEEKFTPKEDWQPGESVDKEVAVNNTGDYDLFVRVKMSEEWTLKDGTTKHGWDSVDDEFHTATAFTSNQLNPDDGLINDGAAVDPEYDESVVAKALAASGWTFNTDDGYWYYNTRLTAGNSTGSLLTSITLAGDTDMGSYIVTKYYTKSVSRPDNNEIGVNDSDAGTKWIAFTGAVPTGATFTRAVSALDNGAPGYAGASYVLTITSEVMQGTKEANDDSDWDVPASLHIAWGID